MLPGTLRELFRRRVPQILGAYLASGWIVLEFTDWLTELFSLTPLFVELEPADPTFSPATRARAWQAQLSRETPGG
jgi:hypothetical protein